MKGKLSTSVAITVTLTRRGQCVLAGPIFQLSLRVTMGPCNCACPTQSRVRVGLKIKNFNFPRSARFLRFKTITEEKIKGKTP